jgi:hypothetical protein
MDLWDGGSIRSGFAEYGSSLSRTLSLMVQVARFYCAALVTATWARNLNDSILGLPECPTRR